MKNLDNEISLEYIRSSGPGGQNVNKVSNAAQLRFDIAGSALPDALKQRLAAWPDQRISGDGVVVIKAQDHRSLPLNRRDALARLQALLDAAVHVPRVRRATKPTWGSQQRRLAGKAQRGQVKSLRGRVSE